MNVTNYDWYVADDEVREAIAATDAAHKDYLQACRDLCDEVGAPHLLQNGRGIVGFYFEGDAPKGWAGRSDQQGGLMFMPDRRSKARRELHARIKAVRVVDMEHFSDQFGGMQMGDIQANGSFWMRGPIFLKHDERVLFGIPKGYNQLTRSMEGLEPVPASEALALTEQRDAAKAAA